MADSDLFLGQKGGSCPSPSNVLGPIGIQTAWLSAGATAIASL